MQLFTDNGFILIGKHSGKHFKKLPPKYVQWAETNITDFKDQLYKARKRRRKANRELRADYAQPWTVTVPKPVNDMPAIPAKSSNGKSFIANKGLRKPKLNRFTSRATRLVGATL